MYIGTLTLCGVLTVFGVLALTLGRFLDSIIVFDEEVEDYEKE